MSTLTEASIQLFKIAGSLLIVVTLISVIAKLFWQNSRIKTLTVARNETHELVGRLKEDLMNATRDYESARRKLIEIDKGRGILAKAFEGASAQMRDMESKLKDAELDRLKLMDQFAKQKAAIQQLEAKLASKTEDYNLQMAALRDLQADYLGLQRNAQNYVKITEARQERGL